MINNHSRTQNATRVRNKLWLSAEWHKNRNNYIIKKVKRGESENLGESNNF